MEAMIGTVVGSVVNIIPGSCFYLRAGNGGGRRRDCNRPGKPCHRYHPGVLCPEKEPEAYAFHPYKRSEKQDLLAVFAIGIPASVTNLMQSLGMALMNRYLVQYGTDKVAAMGIAMKVNMIVMLIMVGLCLLAPSR